MEASSTALTRAGAGALGILALVQLVTALTSDAPPYALVLLLVVCGLSSVSALALLWRGTLGARLTALVAALLSGGGAVLVGTLGLPGTVSAHFGTTGTADVVLAVAVLLLLALDARSRRATEPRVPPYAL